ncbi:DNA helicase II [compost metagenome]
MANNYASLFADVRSSAEQTRPAAQRAEQGSMSDEQYKALVAPFDRSAVVCAGAGAGKTRLLVERVAELLKAGANPQRVAVVTFTRKAANEIRDRLLARFGDKTRLPACGTVHSLALARLASQRISVTIAKDDELTYFLDRLREELPEAFTELSDSELLLGLNRSREEQRDTSAMGIIAYRFEELLQEEDVTDFTGLLKLGLDKVLPAFDHLLVDESQDLSSLQDAFLRKLGRPNARYWYIGDADQAIYAFRGAHGGVMQMLQAKCEDTYVLSANYRSARSIVEHANNVIRVNPDRIEIQWQPQRTDQGEVVIDQFEHGQDELEAVTAWLRESPTTRVALARTQAIIEPLRALELPCFTVHESKGLEWPEVWVMGCEASLFPHVLGIKEEERRLFYVAMTRARDFLRMSYASSRAERSGKPGARHPSPFLFEAHGLEG